MSRRILLAASLLTFAASTACSSSSSNTGTTPPAQDSGTTNENDSSMGAEDSGTPATDSGTPVGDTGTTNPGDSSTLACPPSTSNGTYTSVTYVSATKGTNQCASTDISAFVAACGSAASNTSCGTWFAANVAGQAGDGGGAGTTCGNCIAPMNNNGGIWLDPNGYFGPNYAGCIQLTDTTNGPACASAYNNIQGCEGQYCDQCTTGYEQCGNATTATGGLCASYNTTFTSACAADLGSTDGGSPVASCFPSMGAQDNDPDFTYIINLICGTGQ